MGRSGTHAIINWISCHANSSFVFSKRWIDLEAKTVCFHTMKKLNGIQKISRQIAISDIYPAIKENNVEIIVYLDDPYFLSQPVVEGLSDDMDRFLSLSEIDLNGEVQKPIPNLVILRSPWNNYASLLQWKCRSKLKNSPKRFKRCWMSYAYEYTGRTNAINNKIVCNYDKWFSDKKYRESLSRQIGIDFSDDGLNFVDQQGRGSSFDLMRCQNSAQSMDVLDRWKAIEKGSHNYLKLKSVFGRKHIRKMSSGIFGPIPNI